MLIWSKYPTKKKKRNLKMKSIKIQKRKQGWTSLILKSMQFITTYLRCKRMLRSWSWLMKKSNKSSKRLWIK